MTHKVSEQELNKKCAEILGFKKDEDIGSFPFFHTYEGKCYTLSGSGIRYEFDPFYSGDDLERECIARRQLDAIEDYLEENHGNLWRIISIARNQDEGDCQHQWRLNRIRWCVELLENSNEHSM